MNNSNRTHITRIIIYIFLVLLLLICIIPIWILLINATRTTPQIQQGVSLLPGGNFLRNWTRLTSRGFSLSRGFLNSSIIAFSATFLTVYFSMMTGYALEVYDFRFKRFLYNFILVLVLIPMQVSIIGFYHYMSRLNLTNTFIPLIVPAIAAPASVFFCKQYLEACVVKDLLYAARIDGCGEFGIFNKVMMPIAAPGAFTLGIFSFVASWNNFFTAFIMISRLELYTLPMLVRTLRGDTYRTEYGAIYLGLAVTVVPIIIVFALFSKYIVNGIAMGAIKE